MRNKYQEIAQLYEETATMITNTPEEWMSFLCSACRNYKCSFYEQVLIYAQRPDATAILELDRWNGRFGRWIKKGASSIVIPENVKHGTTHLRHYFDIADTRETKNSRPVPLWTIGSRFERSVINGLDGIFGPLTDTSSLAQSIIQASNSIVADSLSEYIDDLFDHRENSYLEELDDLNLKVAFRNSMQNSIAYMILSRCGINPDDFFDAEDFLPVLNFNTKETVETLGIAVSTTAEYELREISTTVLKLERTERKQGLKVADKNIAWYNENNNPERGNDNGRDNIHESGRLLRPGLEGTGSAGRESGEIRNTEGEVSEKQEANNVPEHVRLRGTAASSFGDRPAGDGAAGFSNAADGKETRRKRRTESVRPDKMGRAYEQHPEFSGGDNPPGAYLQLSMFPSAGEQMTEINSIEKAEEKESSAFSMSQEVMAYALRSGGNKLDSTLKICAWYKKHKNADKNIAFLKNEYGTGGKGFIIDGHKAAMWFDASGICLSHGETALRAANSTLLPWDDVNTRITELLKSGMYMPQNELDEVDQYEIKKLSEETWYVHQDFDSNSDVEFFMDSELFKGGFPDSTEHIAELISSRAEREQITDKLRTFADEYKRDPSIMRFRLHNPSKLLQRYMDTQIESLTFEAAKDFTVSYEMFITQDEIDTLLTRGGNVSDGSYRIYSYFLNSHTAKEKADFLREEYGIGGSGPLGKNEWHDSKGISFKRQYDRDLSLKAEVFLKWNKVSKHIDTLVSEKRYMSPDDIRGIPAYERRELASEVYSFYARQAEDVLRPFPYGSEYHDAIDIIKQQLKDPKQIKEMISGMTLVLENTADFDKSFDSMREAYDDLVSYSEGTFTLFNNIDKGYASVNDDLQDVEVESPTEDVQPDAPDTPEPYPAVEPLPSPVPTTETEVPTALAPPETQSRPENVPISYVYPEIPLSERNNYTITNDTLGHGGAKTKFQNNIKAIETLQTLDSEKRLATPEEQEVLAQYVGWGGLPQAFDENNSNWSDEYAQLKSLLSDEEYTSARATTLNAHYTSPTVIKAMFHAVENMGFRSGNILDPGCGTGNFQGLLSDSMKDSKVIGIEIDPVTGRIAQQLYQKNSFLIKGYEKTNLPDSFFDLAIGNIPFGAYSVSDRRYDKHKFLIHDYFIAKTLDKVRSGGIVAFVTSKGTLDKENPSVRKYIAQRAELLGAIRLPNNAFYANAGTQVTTDILFLQKRDRIIDIEPDWVHLGLTENEVPVNSCYVENPEMVLGTMAYDKSMYGSRKDTTCDPISDSNLEELLNDAIQNISGEYREYETLETEESQSEAIPADPNVRNFSYTVIDKQIYFREDSVMTSQSMSKTATERVKGMIEIRDSVRGLIEYQTEDYPDSVIEDEQKRLGELYDKYTSGYGLLNSRGNKLAFQNDSSYSLLCSLEVIDDEGEFVRKADMFSKRTIRPHIAVTSVDTASEALVVSIAEKACVDLPYMEQLSGKTQEEIIEDLQGVIFRLPNTDTVRYVTVDEYLSGNVREKLKTAREAAEADPEFKINAAALEKVQPKDLSASEISVRLGAVWIPVDVVQQFMYELLDTPDYNRRSIQVHYSEYTNAWIISHKSLDGFNIKANTTYGTKRATAYRLIEDTLNLRDIRIFDTVYEDGQEKRVLNKKETAIAQSKQEAIKSEFMEWIWKDPERRQRLTAIYNERYNSIRPREYDGSHIRFAGINPEITLKEHQINAIARILYGKNALLCHVVGAGKTYEMVAAAMESKRLGICNKSLVVVPNHIIEQFASEWLQLYPAANILVSTKKDFERKNRKKFCARISTGDYDAVIIGHSQFEKIALSAERQERILSQQIDEIAQGIADAKRNDGDNFTIKQMERTRKSLQNRLESLNDRSKKDDVVAFEELGVDRLFVDEAHGFKNLFLATKMRNVGGIAQTEAKKSSDLFMKTQYLNEITGGRGVVFATGTPVSNSMCELYTLQRYLQYDTLVENNLQNFDSWASTFGETVNAIELAPEGTGYRAKTRFARFYNLPELMAMFKEVADIQTADMLDLPVPKANFHTEIVKPSDIQREMVEGLAKRADDVRNRRVDSTEDNMLLITNDGRKLALDQRLINGLLPAPENGKIAVCAGNVYEIWEKYREKRLTQLVFSDLSTPKNDGTFNAYDELKSILISKGVPAAEIAFIHDARTDDQKAKLFAKVRSGSVRVLMGSTQKMGAGTNCQDKLIALHDVDCPWRPADLEQRLGRIVRQGNQNPEVEIYRYVTESTFDSYLFQLVEAKQRFIGQIMTSKSPARSAEDIDETALSYSEIKALATGNPMIIEKSNLEMDVGKLSLLQSTYLSQHYELEDLILKKYPRDIKAYEGRIAGYKKDIETRRLHSPVFLNEFSPMVIGENTYTEKKEAGKALVSACKKVKDTNPVPFGNYRGFNMELSFDSYSKEYILSLKGNLTHRVKLGSDIHGNITRINNNLDGFEENLGNYSAMPKRTLQ